MTGVILRCPNCGTATATLGECEACHEAQVRYYCTNHEPGHWLDKPVCPRCGAKFGDLVRSPARPVPPPSPPPARTTSAPRARPPLDPPAPPLPRRTGPSPWGGGERREPADPWGETPDDVPSARDVRTARMLEILRAASRAGRFPGGRPYDPSEAPRPGSVLGGCLARFVVLVIFLLIAFSLMLALVGGSLFQMIGPYSY